MKKKKKKKMKKKIFVSEISASENGPIICLCSEMNTCDQQSMG